MLLLGSPHPLGTELLLAMPDHLLCARSLLRSHVCFHSEVRKRNEQLPAVDEIPEDPGEITCMGLHRRTRAGANCLILDPCPHKSPSVQWLG